MSKIGFRREDAPETTTDVVLPKSLTAAIQKAASEEGISFEVQVVGYLYYALGSQQGAKP